MKMNKPSLALIFCFSAFLVIEGCVSHDLESGFTVDCTPADADIDYTTEIIPIVTENCTIPGCHGDNPDIPDWNQHAELVSHGAEIQRRITLPLSDPGKMPREGSITEEERQALYCWIENGAPD
jgi:hypothetical protein